ncbi:MAG: hypothetical protein IKX82_00195, partial [Bacilli bacterium]|nr:hypothetical protein [Bacilli bacterium]
MKKKPLIIVGIAYAVAIASLATTNLLHNFFGINGIAEHKIDDDPFSSFDVSTPSSSAPSSSKPKSSSTPETSSSAPSTSIETRETNNDPSPYQTTETIFTRYHYQDNDPTGECQDSSGYNVSFYT